MKTVIKFLDKYAFESLNHKPDQHWSLVRHIFSFIYDCALTGQVSFLP